MPALADGDWALTENPAILRYLARRFPDAKLWPEDARAEARCAEWLAWIASSVHVAYAHVRRPERYASDPQAIEDVVAKGSETCRAVWGEVERKLGPGPWAVGKGTSSPIRTWSRSGPGAAGRRSASTWRGPAELDRARPAHGGAASREAAFARESSSCLSSVLAAKACFRA